MLVGELGVVRVGVAISVLRVFPHLDAIELCPSPAAYIYIYIYIYCIHYTYTCIYLSLSLYIYIYIQDCPLIGSSTGFCTLCGYEMNEIVGRLSGKSDLYTPPPPPPPPPRGGGWCVEAFVSIQAHLQSRKHDICSLGSMISCVNFRRLWVEYLGQEARAAQVGRNIWVEITSITSHYIITYIVYYTIV